MKHICFYLEINFSKNRINIFLKSFKKLLLGQS